MVLPKQNGLRRSKILLSLSLTIAIIMLTAGFLLISLVQTDHVALAANLGSKQWLPVHDLANNDGLTIRMQSDVTSTVPGSTLHYTMTVANNATITTTNFTALARFPMNATYVSGTVTTQIISTLITQTMQPSAYYDPLDIKWAGELAPKTTVHIRFAVKVKEESNCPSNINMIGEIHLPQFAPDIIHSQFVELNCIPVLQLTHTSNVTTTTFSGVIEYQVAIHNTSPVTVNNLTLRTTLPLPDEATYLTGTLTASHGQATYTYGQHAVYWQGAIAPQGDVLVTYALQITRFGSCKTLYSQAYLVAPTLREVHSAVAKVEYRCPQIKALQFTMSASVTQTVPGSTIDYRLTLTNSSDLPTGKLEIVNPLPFGAGYVDGSATATSASVTYDPTFTELRWAGVLPERSAVELSFQARVRDRVRCGLIINNQATVYNTGIMQPVTPTIGSQTIVTCTEAQPWTDFGDAPDSESNHHGMNNIAYQETGVLGRFPTVWEGTPPGEASGPTHRTDHFWLGSAIDAEVDADLTLNNGSEPGRATTNILNNGREDVADWDFDDDGWQNPLVPILNCETSTLLVRVTRSALPTTLKQLWLNVWFDGNRDGDWQDSGDCPASADPLDDKSFEWIVQDWVIDADQLPVDGFLDLQIPTKLVYNPNPTQRVWLRFTLSEQRALRPTPITLADGRGPAYPAFFQVGETEDYLVDGLPQGEPIQVSLQHPTEDEITPTVRIGSKAGFLFLIQPTTGTMPTTTLFQNDLPPGVTLAGLPEFLVFPVQDGALGGMYDGITPLVPTFLPNEGPSGRLEWRGRLRREAGIWIFYEVEVNACPPRDANGQPWLRNIAQVRQPNGSIVTAEAAYLVDCIPTASGSEWLFLPLVNR